MAGTTTTTTVQAAAVRRLLLAGFVLLGVGVLVQQLPAGSVDSLIQSFASATGIGHLLYSIGHACIALGAALVAAGIIIRHIIPASLN